MGTSATPNNIALPTNTSVSGSSTIKKAIVTGAGIAGGLIVEGGKTVAEAVAEAGKASATSVPGTLTRTVVGAASRVTDLTNRAVKAIGQGAGVIARGDSTALRSPFQGSPDTGTGNGVREQADKFGLQGALNFAQFAAGFAGPGFGAGGGMGPLSNLFPQTNDSTTTTPPRKPVKPPSVLLRKPEEPAMDPGNSTSRDVNPQLEKNMPYILKYNNKDFGRGEMEQKFDTTLSKANSDQKEAFTTFKSDMEAAKTPLGGPDVTKQNNAIEAFRNALGNDAEKVLNAMFGDPPQTTPTPTPTPTT